MKFICFTLTAHLKSRYVTQWSGAARIDEEQEIKSWVVQHAPGIPHRLATCVAWHITHGRPQNAAATFLAR